MRDVLAELTGTLAESAFTGLVAAYHLPAGLTLGIAQAVVSGALQGVMQNCYDDINSRALSKREVIKHDLVFDIAERTYFDFASKDFENYSTQVHVLDRDYYQQVFETAEHVSIEAMRQSEMKKIEVLGRYYGREFYVHGYELDFQDIHQMITMVGNLTFRQIVMIRLIKEEFPGLDKTLFVSNPSACVEINRLKDYGIWKTQGASFGINESSNLQLERINTTEYTPKVYEALMLNDLSNADVKRTIDSLRLTSEGENMPIITVEDYGSKISAQEI